MQQPGTIDINLTIKAWAEIVLEKWHTNIVEIPRIDFGYLRDSLKYTLFINAGNDIDKIEFAFKLYGIFVDMGTGKSGKRNIDSDDEWFSRKYYGQVMKLKEILIEKYSLSISWSMKNVLSAPLDQSLTAINLRNT